MAQHSAPSDDAPVVELTPRIHALDLGLAEITLEVVPGRIEVPRYIAPRAVSFAGKPDRTEVWVTVRCGEDGPGCHELTVLRGVTGELLRTIPVQSIVRGLVWRNLVRRTAVGYEPYRPRDVAGLDGDELLQAVAEIYSVAAYVGDAPRLTVQDALGVSKATADRRIRAARAAGYITVEAPAGRGGRIEQGD